MLRVDAADAAAIRRRHADVALYAAYATCFSAAAAIHYCRHDSRIIFRCRFRYA